MERSPLATQKTPDQAAALIQARVRCQQQRRRHQCRIRAITKLQAWQRGRYTRREFQKLLEFYNDQESFLRESKRRQIRLWHREQELYFLQHTSAQEMERIRAFQYGRSARVIQREWRRGHPQPIEEADLGRLGRPFDPFGLVGAPRDDTTISNATMIESEWFGDMSLSPPVALDHESLIRRRTELREQLQRQRKEAQKKKKKNADNTDKATGKPTRRELYTQLLALRVTTAQKLVETKARMKELHDPERELATTQLRASIRHRLSSLQDESRMRSLLNPHRRPPLERIDKETQAFETSTKTWSDERKRQAWDAHTRVMHSVLGKGHWYETAVAGMAKDIRDVVRQSPWDHERQVWQWPTVSSDDNQQENDARDPTANSEDSDDDSLWWRAHAAQSHLGYRWMQAKQRRANSKPMAEDALATPEMLVNPTFFDLHRKMQRDKQREDVRKAVDAEMTGMQQQILERVRRIEKKITANTRAIQLAQEFQQQLQARKTQEELSATHIQRVVRGKLGRQRALEHRAQYFVMVRGRAIRKGKCEECGDQQAVLECRECEESLHFCPVCWVQVHSTRRRKTHVPIPMALQSVKPNEAKPVASAVPSSVPGLEHDRRLGIESLPTPSTMVVERRTKQQPETKAPAPLGKPSTGVAPASKPLSIAPVKQASRDVISAKPPRASPARSTGAGRVVATPDQAACKIQRMRRKYVAKRTPSTTTTQHG